MILVSKDAVSGQQKTLLFTVNLGDKFEGRMCLTLSDTLKAIDLIERLKGMPAEPTCIPSAAHLLLMKSRNFTCTSEMHLH